MVSSRNTAAEPGPKGLAGHAKPDRGGDLEEGDADEGRRPRAEDQSTGLARTFLRVRGASAALIETLEPEDCVVQTIPEVSPTKWHLAHVTWFFEQFVLEKLAPGYAVFDERYAFLFNSYYLTVGPMHRRPKRGLLSRPLLSDVLAYRDHVDEAMTDLIADRGGDPELEFLVTLGLNHEQQHQELMLTDIKHVLWTNPLGPAFREARPASKAGTAPAHEFVPRPGGRFEVGAKGLDVFFFDNETPRHEVLVRDHVLGNRLITNGEYRAFIDDGGYRRPALWLSDGWARVAAEGWDRPLYWSEDLGREFRLSGWEAIEDAAPVCHVSYYEADAYARWAGARLPTEQEWELAADGTPVRGNTLDRGTLHPIPASASVGGPPDREAAAAPGQLWGDVWEWTASPYVAYPGFAPLGGSLGEYNGKFMANQMVVRGGSCASWADHLRATYRSFFYPHDRWQFLGIRLARDV